MAIFGFLPVRLRSHSKRSAFAEQHERPQEPLDLPTVVDIAVAVDGDPDCPTIHDQQAVDEIDAAGLASEFARHDVVDHQRAFAGDAEAAEPHPLAKQPILLLSGHWIAIFRAMDPEQVVILIVVDLSVYQPHDRLVDAIFLYVDLRLAGHLNAEA